MTLLWWFAETTVVAGALAVLVWGICRRFGARLGPGARHLMWLVVFAKLLTPPVFAWRVPDLRPAPARPVVVPSIRADRSPELPSSADDFDADWATFDPPFAPAPVPEPRPAKVEIPTVAPRPLPVATAPPPPASRPWSWNWNAVVPVVIGVWGAGALIELARQGARIVRFRRLVRAGKPAPDWLTKEVGATAARLGVAPPPTFTLASLPGPMIWCWGAPTLLIPERLPGALEPSKWAGVLIHELAHLRRRDHWTARIDLVAGAVWWFSPVHRFVRSRLRHESELACDAWVVDLGPESESRRAYAEALVDVCEHISLSASKFALGFGSGSGVEAMEGRLKMILRETKPNPRPGRWTVAAAALALLALPGWTAEPQKPKESEPPKPALIPTPIPVPIPAPSPAAAPIPAPSPAAAPAASSAPRARPPAPAALPAAPSASAKPVSPVVRDLPLPRPADPSIPPPKPPTLGQVTDGVNLLVLHYSETRSRRQGNLPSRFVIARAAEATFAPGLNAKRVRIDELLSMPKIHEEVGREVLTETRTVRGTTYGDENGFVTYYDGPGGDQRRPTGKQTAPDLPSRLRIGDGFLRVDALTILTSLVDPMEHVDERSVVESMNIHRGGNRETAVLTFRDKGRVSIERTVQDKWLLVDLIISLDVATRPAADRQKAVQRLRLRADGIDDKNPAGNSNRIDVIEDELSASGELLTRTRHRLQIERIDRRGELPATMFRPPAPRATDVFDEEGDGPAHTPLERLGRLGDLPILPAPSDALKLALARAISQNPFGPVDFTGDRVQSRTSTSAPARAFPGEWTGRPPAPSSNPFASDPARPAPVAPPLDDLDGSPIQRRSPTVASRRPSGTLPPPEPIDAAPSLTPGGDELPPSAVTPAVPSGVTTPPSRPVPTTRPAPEPTPSLPAPRVDEPVLDAPNPAAPAAAPASSMSIRGDVPPNRYEGASVPFVSIDELNDQLQLARLRLGGKEEAVRAAFARVRVGEERLAQYQKLKDKNLAPKAEIDEHSARLDEAVGALARCKAEFEEARLLIEQAERRIQRETKRLDRRIEGIRGEIEQLRRVVRNPNDPAFRLLRRELSDLYELRGVEATAASPAAGR